MNRAFADDDNEDSYDSQLYRCQWGALTSVLMTAHTLCKFSTHDSLVGTASTAEDDNRCRSDNNEKNSVSVGQSEYSAGLRSVHQDVSMLAVFKYLVSTGLVALAAKVTAAALANKNSDSTDTGVVGRDSVSKDGCNAAKQMLLNLLEFEETAISKTAAESSNAFSLSVNVVKTVVSRAGGDKLIKMLEEARTSLPE